MQRNTVKAWRRANPRLVQATLLIVQAVLSKEIAAQVGEPLKGRILTSAERTISTIADDYCGNGKSGGVRPPTPLPGPRGLDLALSVATFANVIAKSVSLRNGLMAVAGALTKKAYEE